MMSSLTYQRDTSASATPVARWRNAGWTLFLIVPLLIFTLREWPAAGMTDALRVLTLADLPADIVQRSAYVLAIPLGSLFVVFVRLTLGLRSLGPFRPILIALALQMTDILAGLVFLVATFVLIVLVRPLILRQGLAFFARTALLISVVANFAVATVLAGKFLALDSLVSVIHFPLVVLCLVSVSFARKIETEGLRLAVWRAAVTAATAVVITLVVMAPGVAPFLLSHPEALVLQIGLIVLVGRHGAARAFDHLNPSPARPKSSPARLRKKRRETRKTAP